MKMKPGKYVHHKFTADQKKARAKWERAREQRLAIEDALMVVTYRVPRQELHDRLDRRLDTIERMEASAKELFPDVSESYTIASGTMSF